MLLPYIFCLLLLTGANLIGAGDFLYVHESAAAQEQTKTQVANQRAHERSDDAMAQSLLEQSREYDKKAASVVKHAGQMIVMRASGKNSSTAPPPLDLQTLAYLQRDHHQHQLAATPEVFVAAAIVGPGSKGLFTVFTKLKRQEFEDRLSRYRPPNPTRCCFPAAALPPVRLIQAKVGRDQDGGWLWSSGDNVDLSEQGIANFLGVEGFSDGRLQFKMSQVQRKKLRRECSDEQLSYLSDLHHRAMAGQEDGGEVLHLDAQQFAAHCSLLSARRKIVENNYNIAFTDKQQEVLALLPHQSE